MMACNVVDTPVVDESFGFTLDELERTLDAMYNAPTLLAGTLAQVCEGKQVKDARVFFSYVYPERMIKDKDLTHYMNLAMGSTANCWREAVACVPQVTNSATFSQFTKLVKELRDDVIWTRDPKVVIENDPQIKPRKLLTEEELQGRVLRPLKQLAECLSASCLRLVCETLCKPVLVQLNSLPSNMNGVAYLWPSKPMKYHTITPNTKSNQQYVKEMLYEGDRHSYIHNTTEVNQYEPKLADTSFVMPKLFNDIQTYGVEVTITPSGVVVVHDVFNIHGIDCSRSHYTERKQFLKDHLLTGPSVLLAEELDAASMTDVVLIKKTQGYEAGKRKLFRVKSSPALDCLVLNINALNHTLQVETPHGDRVECKLRPKCWEKFTTDTAKKEASIVSMVINRVTPHHKAMMPRYLGVVEWASTEYDGEDGETEDEPEDHSMDQDEIDDEE